MPTFHRLKKEIGLKVLEKFNNQCQNCKSKIGLVVHHIERRDINSEDYNEFSNLTVLCKKCHMSYHRKSGHILSIGGNGNPFGRRGTSEVIYCKKCDRPQHAKGLCNKHYMEYLRSAD